MLALAGTAVSLGGTRRVGGLLGVAGRLSGTVSPFRAEQGTSLDAHHLARLLVGGVRAPVRVEGLERGGQADVLPQPQCVHAQLCPILRDPMDCSLPGSSIRGVFRARALEWGAITFSETRYVKGFKLWALSENPLAKA